MLLAGGEDSNSCTTEKSSTVGRAQQRAERKGARRPELLVGAFSGWLVRSPASFAGDRTSHPENAPTSNSGRRAPFRSARCCARPTVEDFSVVQLLESSPPASNISVQP